MEYVDVLTTDGAPTGQRKSKADAHRDGDWHLSVHVWIASRDGRVLLQKRSLAKENNPGLWDVSVAGHVSAGESAVDSALREIEEEIGLVLDRDELRHVARLREQSVLHGGRYIDNEFHEVFIVDREVALDDLVLQAGEVDAVAWIDPSSLLTQSDLVPHPEEYDLICDLMRARVSG